MESRVLWLVLGLLCIGCNQDDVKIEKTASSKTDTAIGEAGEGHAAEEVEAAPSIPDLDPAARSKGTTTTVARGPFAASSIPDRVKVRGKVVGGVTWTDANGTNVLVLSEKRTAGDPSKCMGAPCEPQTLWLFAEHAVVDDGAARSLRTVKQSVKNCEFDLLGAFIDEALEVTDLDEDGIGEVTFAYRYTCTSDVSPFALKLLVLENGDKYIIRGTTRVDVGGGQVIGGDKKVDASLDKGDPRFRSHATRVWDRIVGLDPW